MSKLGKKILSAFVEIGEDAKNDTPSPAREPENVESRPASPAAPATSQPTAATSQRFTDYFDKLFSDANIPGPDYYEFSRMIIAMRAIPDERARYVAAFAGLQVQGLDKEKLLSTASEYLRVLTTDAERFRQTVDTALQEKVQKRSAEADEKSRRIQALSEEILQLQQQIAAMQQEIAESKEKLAASSGGYTAECDRRRQQIEADIDKIKNFIP